MRGIFHNNKKIHSGFTLIELLIVIAIIGILAGTVLISVGDKTDQAKDQRTKIGVSSIRTLAFSAALDGSTSDICDKAFDEISADTTGWTWDGTAECKANDADTDGDICCAANSDGKWVVWGKLSTANKVYCADSANYFKELTLAGTDDEDSGSTKVIDGDLNDSPVSCN